MGRLRESIQMLSAGKYTNVKCGKESGWELES